MSEEQKSSSNRGGPGHERSAIPGDGTHYDVIVAVGTDHHPFDRLVRWVDEWAGEHPEVSVLVQRGTTGGTEFCPSVETLPHGELCERFSRASVVVSHGGPSTVMDARMAGSFPIVVARNPAFGEHVDQHQMRFAQHLRKHELAKVVSERFDFLHALEGALAAPDDYRVPVEPTDIAGVVQVGRVLDQLLGITTPLQSPPSGVETPNEPVSTTESKSTTAASTQLPTDLTQQLSNSSNTKSASLETFSSGATTPASGSTPSSGSTPTPPDGPVPADPPAENSNVINPVDRESKQ